MSQQATAARTHFEQLTRRGEGGAPAWFALAQACQALNDLPAALAALDQALAAAPDNLQLMLFKGDLLGAAGNAVDAANFYRAALNAAPPAERLPPALREHVARARAACEQYAQQFERRLDGALLEAGIAPQQHSTRFRQSLDLMLGRKEIFLQQPRLYYFPGLPHTQFFERTDLPWLDQVEASTDEIRAELLEVMHDHDAFEPYIKPDPALPVVKRNGLYNNRDWSAFYLWKNGERIEQNAARCPKTLAALAGVPMSQISGRAPTVLFSLMRPGTHIPPHTGIINTRMICHLPLIVPPGCALRVGNETREVRAGKAWAFDDSIEHEAWNRSDETRVILLFEAWRPELTTAERQQVGALLGAIDGSKDWAV
ncbi:hypothetical protein GTP38_14695 [Duganella sp. FT94W]|uniref:Aspartyl/asparaginy/proline hydroxylase domain-containing protein n=1 Tax=Duganella lactea TaxID=2692173 RepID=A0ABW9V9E4_9BURK|nr:aspartyl/asparaginyl beta-hydroxylase domain-containing protein [Duganella lactea]MYM35581.1 hypothetical protein [Duganella lactea]